MRIAAPPYRLDYHPLLIEEAVLIAVSGHPEEAQFRQERDRLYEMADGQEKELAFQNLHQDWFDRLELSTPLREVFGAWPILKESTGRAVLLKSLSRKDEGAELYLAPENGLVPGNEKERRTVIIHMKPERLARPDDLLPFLRHELLHIVDLLDPAFGYRPFPEGASLSVADWSSRERYRLLWDVTVEGRLVRMGWLDPSVRGRKQVAFKRVFSGPARELEESFSRFFDQEGHTHDELLAFSRFPDLWPTEEGSEKIHRGRCSLCQFPYTGRPEDLEELSPQVIEIIRAIFPTWQPGEPVCPQCIDLLTAQQSVD